MSRKKFIESVGATCKNWGWGWSFINEKEKFIIFGLGSNNIEGNKGIILGKSWEASKRSYKQSIKHVRLIEEEGYVLKTFPTVVKRNSKTNKHEIKSFTPKLTKKTLLEDNDSWYVLLSETYDEYQETFDNEVKKSLSDNPEARAERIKNSPKKPVTSTVTTTIYSRNSDVKAEVLIRANGTCENCNNPAPFIRKKDNTPYLEVHHIIQLANGGDDTVKNAQALCPNCHREKHHGIET